jgi:hypothetical protein
MSLYGGISLSLHEDVKMGKMNIVIDDKLEEQFRKAVFQRKGMKKGNISDAIQEAIVNWIGWLRMSLKEFKADKQYLSENYDKLKSEHPDEFVVIHKGQVVASGVALEEVFSEARKEIGDKLNDSVVEYLSTRKVEMVV